MQGYLGTCLAYRSSSRPPFTHIHSQQGKSLTRPGQQVHLPHYYKPQGPLTAVLHRKAVVSRVSVNAIFRGAIPTCGSHPGSPGETQRVCSPARPSAYCQLIVKPSIAHPSFSRVHAEKSTLHTTPRK